MTMTKRATFDLFLTNILQILHIIFSSSGWHHSSVVFVFSESDCIYQNARQVFPALSPSKQSQLSRAELLLLLLGRDLGFIGPIHLSDTVGSSGQ